MAKTNKGHIHCPANAWDCPYYYLDGCCMMYPELDPLEECDDFAYFWDEGDDYICHDDHSEEEKDDDVQILGYELNTMF